MNLPLWAALLEASTGPRSKTAETEGGKGKTLLLVGLQRGRDPKTAETAGLLSPCQARLYKRVLERS